jgi:DNA helicase-2/ATP-dependent DNA helicase PcrA
MGVLVTAEHIIEGLNPPQREAVTTIAGPLLILAGPGSGKTRVIAHRIAYLVDVIGVAPWRILSVTFTNKAAKEMRSRVAAHLEEAAADLMLGTFHSICARLLRTEADRIGLNRSFNIFDDSDQMSLMKRACEYSNVDTKRFKERAILSAISHAKSELVSPETYARGARDYFGEVVARVYARYQELLVENGALDFDDLIVRAVEMLQNNAEVREKYQERFLHVLVDEFQDTNIAQYQLARLFAAKHPNICVVGDPDQSIYSWRSADIRNILNFERDYPDAKTVLLEQNYRSTQNILDAAHAVISGNKQRKEKSLWTSAGEGEPIVAYEAYDEAEEADFVANEITSLVEDERRSYSEFAVMYRTNAHSRALEEALIRAKVPYALVGGTRFYERREVKDILGYLRLIQNPHDAVSFARVVNVPGRGIGAKTLSELERWARERGVPAFTALQLVAEQESAVRPSVVERHPIGAKQTKTLIEFQQMIAELQDVAEKNNMTTLLDGVLERTGYRKHLFAEFEESEGEERWENIGELRNVASEYDGLSAGHGLVAFLEDVALISDADTTPDNDDPGSGRVTLITLHSAKGLEYPIVFMIAMEEGVLPHIRSFDDQAQMEEERRLCYVGMTRAKQRLYLVRAFKRYNMGSSSHNPPSRFFKDVPQVLISQRSAVRSQYEAVERGPSRYREGLARKDDRPPVPEELVFAGGERVRHPRFGEGIVVSSQKVKDDQEVSVAFKGEVGMKKLMLSFAPLEKL